MTQEEVGAMPSRLYCCSFATWHCILSICCDMMMGLICYKVLRERSDLPLAKRGV